MGITYIVQTAILHHIYTIFQKSHDMPRDTAWNTALFQAVFYTTIFIHNGGMYEKFRTTEGSYDSVELPAGNKTCPGTHG